MLSLDDIMGMCECTEEEIAAIAMHEHVPDAIASEMGAYLTHCENGIPRMKIIIKDDIEYARKKGNLEEANRLNEVLKHFVASHPEYLNINKH